MKNTGPKKPVCGPSPLILQQVQLLLYVTCIGDIQQRYHASGLSDQHLRCLLYKSLLICANHFHRCIKDHHKHVLEQACVTVDDIYLNNILRG